jgi:hypothetical protein
MPRRSRIHIPFHPLYKGGNKVSCFYLTPVEGLHSIQTELKEQGRH